MASTAKAWADALGDLARGALELLSPSTCAACGADCQPDRALCAPCDAQLPRIAGGGCSLCQQPLLTPATRCDACAASPSVLHACVAAVRFADEVETWMRRFKYPRPGFAGLDGTPLAVVAGLVCEAAALAPPGDPDLVVPVPLHPARLRERGFSPAGLLARALARRGAAARLPFDAVALVRTRDTPSQTGLDRRQRRRNVRGAFRPRVGFRAPPRVWLIDDVVTTGATLEQAARALRDAGARTVVAVCAARTPVLSPSSSTAPGLRSPSAGDRDPPAS